MKETFETIKQLLTQYVDCEEAEIGENTAFIKDLRMNSFDLIAVIGELEDTYHVSVSTDHIGKIETVGELSAYIQSLLA